MKATAERLEKNTVVLEVEIEPEKFSKAVDQAYKKIVKRVNIPGFRKGKAPRIILERYVGKKALYDEAVEIILPDAYMNAIEDTGIEPVSQPELELIQVEEGKPVVFKAKVVVKPEVKLGQYKGVEVDDPYVPVSSEDVQKELERLQGRHAKLITLEEGAVATGDLVTVDFEGKIDDTPFEGGTANDYTFEIGSGSFLPDFEDQILGMAVNETRSINVNFPRDYGREELAGKEAVFTVTVKSIKRKELSPLDDEFAKDVSEFDSLEELRTDLTNKLEKAAQDIARAEIRRQALAKAVENAEAEIPKEMIDSRVEEMIRSMNQRLTGQGISMDKYLTYTNTKMEDLMEKVRPDAEKSVERSLVLDAVAKAENLTVSDEEIDAEIERMSKETKQDPVMVRRIIESQNQLDFIKESILNDKTLQFLVDQAIIRESPEGRKKEGEQSGLEENKGVEGPERPKEHGGTEE
jgi:trigger factor